MIDPGDFNQESYVEEKVMITYHSMKPMLSMFPSTVSGVRVGQGGSCIQIWK